MVIAPSGRVGVNTTSPQRVFDVNGEAGGTQQWVVNSDARLKKDVRQIADALGLVKQLRGVRYHWRLAEEREVGKAIDLPIDEPRIGFIAQEVVAVVPEAVVAPKTGAEGGVYGLQTSNLLPVLVEAMKEQHPELADQISKTLAPKNSGGRGGPSAQEIQAPYVNAVYDAGLWLDGSHPDYTMQELKPGHPRDLGVYFRGTGGTALAS